MAEAANENEAGWAVKLDRFVRARNNLRSCQAAAEGFTSGQRIFNLKQAHIEEGMALRDLGEWVERAAREALNRGGANRGAE